MATTDLTPFRDRLNVLDEQLIDILAERFGICREVAKYKKLHGVAMMQPARVEEVKNRNAAMGEKKGVDPRFVKDLYTLIIGEACRLEDDIIDES